MSKLNINKTEWLELVFEGKNKAYGAYQLRQENGATTTKAFFSGLALVAGLASLPMILSSFTDKPIVDEPKIPGGCVIRVVDLPPTHPIVPPKPSSGTTKPSKSFINPVVKPANEVDPSVETPVTNTGNNTPDTGNTNPSGANSGPGTTLNPSVIETPKVEPNETFLPAVLEKNPMFPGGIEEFLKLVGKRFQAPEMEEASTVRIIVIFIVEKDGTLSNIKVPRSAGEELDEEAIRVLKSIKTKWEPGIYEGAPVRTQYSLPIVVRTN